MKDKAAVSSVIELCELLSRSRLLAAADVQQLEQRWRKEAREPADLGEFARWLEANQYVTGFQVNMLQRGHAARLLLGPYKLLDRLGRGRQGTVYKAIHRLGRLVAIKVLPPSRAKDPQALARFQAEVHLAQSLQHPNVVRTRDAGTDHGLHYLVMDYLVGQTLHETLARRGRLGVEEAADIVCQALQGLQYLHQQGLVHRNLEPANLMLVRPEEEASPALGPAGVVVKILDAGAGQAQNAEAADTCADIYSLGCVLSHALAGRPPLQDSGLPLRACNPEVPEALELIVNRMMARDPAQGYPTPDQAAGDLRTFLAGAPSRAAPIPVESAADQSSAVPPEMDWDVVLEPVPYQPSSAADSPGPLELILPSDNPDASDVASGQVAEQPDTTLIKKWDGFFRQSLRIDRRDCLLLILGAGGLLTAEAIGWLIGWLARKRRPAKPRTVEE